MFSLFRKEGSDQPLSQHEVVAMNHPPASGLPAPDAGTLDGSAPGTDQARQVPDSESTTPTARAAAGVDGPAPTSAHALDSTPSAVDDGPAGADGEGSSVDKSVASGSWLEDLPVPATRAGRGNLRARRRGKRLERPVAPGEKKRSHTPQQRLLLLDSWRRSGLPAGDFAALVGISKHTLYKWNQQFEEFGPEGLMDQPRRERTTGRLPELTKRTILMLKESHPEWGCERISDMLLRGPALAASPSSVARVLHEAGYETVQEPTRVHRDKVRRFERARPNQLWQTDLFTFMLKRQNRRVYLVGFMDDHSRFIVSYGLHASASTALVIEALEAGISSYGPPEEVLTDNGPQYVTWRGKSQFTRRLEQHGIRQIVARPRRPQTLGKIERFWGTLWREFLETAVFTDLADARTRIGLFIDYHNFQRVHRGIDGLVPADRFFGAATEVARTLKERVAANALELARHGEPRAPFYVTGQLDGESFSVHAEGPRLILTRPGQRRQEVELAGPRTAADESGALGVPAAGAPSPDAPSPDAPSPDAPSPWPLPIPVCPVAGPGAESVDEQIADEENGADGSEDAARDEQTGGDA